MIRIDPPTMLFAHVRVVRDLRTGAVAGAQAAPAASARARGDACSPDPLRNAYLDALGIDRWVPRNAPADVGSRNPLDEPRADAAR